jgi:hypothetical protein
MNVQSNYITPETSYYSAWHSITNRFNPLNCWYNFLVCKKSFYLVQSSHSPFLWKYIFACWFHDTSVQSYSLYCHKSNLRFDSSFSTFISEPAQCWRLSAFSQFSRDIQHWGKEMQTTDLDKLLKICMFR